MVYAAGAKLRPDEGPILYLPDILEEAARHSPTGGFTIYEDSASFEELNVHFVSYPFLLSAARSLARCIVAATGGAEKGEETSRKVREIGDQKTRIMLDPDLPRRYLIIAFWACMLAGKRPCLLTVPRTWEKSRRQKWIQQSWEQLRFPPLISDSSLHPLSEACCSHILSLPLSLHDTSPELGKHFGVDTSRASEEAVAFYAVSQEGCIYSYSAEAIYANIKATSAVRTDASSRGSSSLSWMPFGLPTVLLSHCEAVYLRRSEVHFFMDGLLKPTTLLKIVARHRLHEVSAPTMFFRRALQTLRVRESAALPACCLKGLAGVRQWTVLYGGEFDLSCRTRPGELEEFQMLILQLAGSSPSALPSSPAQFHIQLLSPWGNVVAHTGLFTPACSREFSGACTVAAGMEARIRGTMPGTIQIRGLAALPGLACSADLLESGWISTGLSGSLETFPNCDHHFHVTDIPSEVFRVSGVEYTAEELEAALELAPEVTPGSAAAVRLLTQGQEMPLLLFNPSDPRAAERERIIKALRSHLAVTLGIIPRLGPLPASQLLRSWSGRPYRELERRTEVQEFTSAFLTGKAEELLPSEWAFEEEYKPYRRSPANNTANEEDEDALEERLEGVQQTEELPEQQVSGPETIALVLSNLKSQDTDSARLAKVVCSSLVQTSKPGLPRWAAYEVDDVEAPKQFQELAKTGKAAALVHLLQTDAWNASDVTSLIEILQAWSKGLATQAPEQVSSVLNILCVSTGRCAHLCGASSDPRKHLLTGVLLSASAELPLRCCHVDAAPGPSNAEQAEQRQTKLAETLALTATDLLTELGFPAEVLVDSDGNRLARRLKPMALEVKKTAGLNFQRVLMAGGAGGVGALWAQFLKAETLILLGRSPPAGKPRGKLDQLKHAAFEVLYIPVDICDKRRLQDALQNCAAQDIDFACSLCESFRPLPLCDFDGTSMDLPLRKLCGAENFVSVLSTHRKVKKLPVLFTSTAVSVNGAAQLAQYAAGARALEAFCARERCCNDRTGCDVRCVALSAWDGIGITEKFPRLAAASPAAGLKVLTAHAGVLALEAVFQRFRAPRYGVLTIGIDACHPRFAALTGGKLCSGPAAGTTSMQGCIEIVQVAVRTVLGRDAQLGDSFVQIGLDSMSSMSLHGALCESSGDSSLPPSIFYDNPTILAVAKLLHKQAMAAKGPLGAGMEGMDDIDASLMESPEARQSYHLSLAREALLKKDFEEVRHRCQQCWKQGSIVGQAQVVVSRLEIEACRGLGLANEWRHAAEATVRLCEDVFGRDHPDTSIAAVKMYEATNWGAEGGLQARRGGPGTPMDAAHAALADRHKRFMSSVTWVEAAGYATSSTTQCASVWLVPSGSSAGKLQILNLDGQKLSQPSQGQVPCLGVLGRLEALETLKLRRNQLAEVPSELGRLVRLRELWLTQNSLSELPATFGNLSKLRVLALERNRLAKLPSCISKLRGLLQLGLDEQETAMTELCTVPAAVLSILRGRGCQALLPALDCGAKHEKPNLNTVFWANNGLSSEPKLVAFAQSLRLLDLAHNRIAMITSDILGLRNLRDLSLAGNLLQHLPASIGRMRSLQQLWLHGNYLSELPDELGDLEALAILELHHNRLLSLPTSLYRLSHLNWFFAHGNCLTDASFLKTLSQLPRIKIVGLGCNKLQLHDLDLRKLGRASFGLGWNPGVEAGHLTEALTTSDLFWDKMEEDTQEVLVITFSAQGAPVAQGQAEVRALRDSFLKVDALYVCDPANAWFMQDPSQQWRGLAYFEKRISAIAAQYPRVFAWGGSMGGSAALLFASLANRVHAFSPQVDLVYTWPSFATATVREDFRRRVQESVRSCRGHVHVHVGAENHTDNRHAAALPSCTLIHLHETANHNTMKHLKLRRKLLQLLKFEVADLFMEVYADNTARERHSRQVLSVCEGQD
ncbi:Erbin [Symbiodinium necroappetens]|uniref:Erbin protein n=1 Tax=Symbiodinium necroappetens TaxID=1628268 RepID=A0A812SJU3_9DINO|nr:Erbin [Symbiodinium necroappetens]